MKKTRRRCWGKWSSEAFNHGWLGCCFRPTRGFEFTEEVGNGGLMMTLMLLELCESCCAGTAQPNGAGLRCRTCGRMTFGTEGVKEPKAPRDGCASARG
jgi:hypothetical protein